MITYAILIILFSFFYTFVQVNPEKTAENLQKNGSYIPSVRPGRETEKYMSSLLKRLATIGAVFLAFISIGSNCGSTVYAPYKLNRAWWYISLDLDFNWYRRYETTRRLPIETSVRWIYES